MTRAPAIFATLIAAVLSRAAIAEEAADASGPTQALIAYDVALRKGDVKGAKDLTARFKTIPEEALNHYTAQYSERAEAGELAVEPAAGSAKVVGEFAVVTFSDGKKDRPDYDPAYLIKQDGEWRVFLRLTQWDHPMFDLSTEQKKQLGELQEWFAAEKKRLYGR